MVFLNVFGSGTKRRKALGDRYNDVQGLVNKISASGLIHAGSGGSDVEKVRKVLEGLRPTDQDYDEFIDEFLNALKEEA